jgi:hypothetical protein
LAEAGVGWPQIATVLGVSRQAARQAALRRQPRPQPATAPGQQRQGIDGGERWG